MIKGTVWSKINCDTIQHTLTKQNLGFYVKLASVHIFKAPYIPDDIACVAVACSRLRDGGGKSFSNKKCEKRVRAGEIQGGGACTHFFNDLFRYISS